MSDDQPHSSASVPFTPGASDQSAPIWPPPRPAVPPRQRIPTVVAIVLALGLAAVVALTAALAVREWRTESPAPASDDVITLETVADRCEDQQQYGGEVGDGGQTLTFDMEGNDGFSGGDQAALMCVLWTRWTPRTT